MTSKVIIFCLVVISTTSAQFNIPNPISSVLQPAIGIGAAVGLGQQTASSSVDLLPVIGVDGILGVKQRVGKELLCNCPAGGEGRLIRYFLVSGSAAHGNQKILGDDVICACPVARQNAGLPDIGLNAGIKLGNFEIGAAAAADVGKTIGSLLSGVSELLTSPLKGK